MKLKENNKLSRLSQEIGCDSDVLSVLKYNKIPCISLCANEIYDGDDKLAFAFGHKHWNKMVTKFWDDEFYYYAVGTTKQLTKILKKELEAIREEQEK